MASPLSVLRRYQFAFFVVFGVVCMLVFVIGDPLNQWLGSRNRGGGGRPDNSVVVRWTGGELRENELGYSKSVRAVIAEFLAVLQSEAQKKNGFPTVRRLELLAPSEEAIFYTHLFAQRAEAVGMSTSDEAALIYLEHLTADLIPRAGIGQIFEETVGKKISGPQLLNEIKTALLAENYLSLTYPDVTTAQLPAQAWDYHLRLNRRVKAEVVPVKVADLKYKITKRPTESEITTLYEKGKDRYPDPASPEAGFKRHRKAAFEYVRADRKKFEDEEKAKVKSQVTDQEIQEYYDKNKDLYRVPTTPAAPSGPAAATPTTPEVKPDPTKPAENKDEKKTDEKASDKKASDKKDTDKKDTDKKDTEPAAKKDGEQPPAKEETKKTDAEKDGAEKSNTDPKATESNPTDPKSTGKDDNKADDKKAAEPAPEVNKGSCGQEPAATPTPEKAAEKSPPPEGGAEKKSEPPAPATPATETKTADAPGADKKPASDKKDEKVPEPAKSDAKETPAATPGAAEKGATTPPISPAASAITTPAAEVKYKPLDDKLKEEIREELAGQKALSAAQKRLSDGFEEISRAIEKYSRERRSAEVTKKAPPIAPDLAKLAEKHNMTLGSTPLADPTQIQETELGKTRGFTRTSTDPIPFHVIAYLDGIPERTPSIIRGTRENNTFDVLYLYWKTKEEPPVVPTLKDIREEVIDAWKTLQTVSVAEEEAKRLAESAQQSGKKLKEFFANKKDLKVTDTNQFTWMTRGFVPGMGGVPQLSSVEGVDNPGQDFMKSVFKLKVGQVGTAINQPKSIIYVVRIDSELPSEEVLREQFLQSGNSFDLRQIAVTDRMELREFWFESIRKDMNVKWEREPQS